MIGKHDRRLEQKFQERQEERKQRPFRSWYAKQVPVRHDRTKIERIEERRENIRRMKRAKIYQQGAQF